MKRKLLNGLAILSLAIVVLILFPLSTVTFAADIFGPHVEYGAGGQPYTVTTGDFNGDGKMDMATANGSSNTVSVLLGNGDGTFQTHVDYNTMTGSYAYSIATMDFNGDRKIDMAVTNLGSNTISIFRGNGDGTFQLLGSYSVGLSYPPYTIVTEDFNRDGNEDMATVSTWTVVVFLGNGDGTFQTPVSYYSGADASLVAGDFNGDGKIDLAATGSYYTPQNFVSILLGNGDGTFQLLGSYGTGFNPLGIATGDFNGDGKTDLITANGSPNTVSVLMGNGDGTFQPYVDYTTADSGHSVAVADFTGDGKMDVVMTNWGPNTISLLRGNGDGTFQPYEPYSTGVSPHFVATGDFNGDGKTDMVTANMGDVSILLNISKPIDVLGCIQLKGSPVTGALVTLKQRKETDKTAITDAQGCYRFDMAVSGKAFQVVINGPVVP